MKKRNIITLVIVGAVLIAIIAKLTSNKEIIDQNSQVKDRSNIPTAVSVSTVTSQLLNGQIVRPSIVNPNEKATISPSATGKILSINYDLGTYVSKGQVIGTIDTKILQTQLKNIKLTISKLESDYKRNQELFKGNALSETNLIDSKFALDAKKIEEEQLEKQISDGNIIAPISGIITDRKNLAGEFVSVGSPLATVVDVNSFKINVFLNEKEVRNVKKGQSVTIKADAIFGKTFTGKVNYVAPTGDDNYNYKVEVIVSAKENKELIAGTYVNVFFAVDSNIEAIMIPKKALVEGVKKPYVYIKLGDKAVRKNIVIGQEVGELIQVVSGLEKGQEVIIDGQVNITNGSLISTKSKK